MLENVHKYKSNYNITYCNIHRPQPRLNEVNVGEWGDFQRVKGKLFIKYRFGKDIVRSNLSFLYYDNTHHGFIVDRMVRRGNKSGGNTGQWPEEGVVEHVDRDGECMQWDGVEHDSTSRVRDGQPTQELGAKHLLVGCADFQ